MKFPSNFSNNNNHNNTALKLYVILIQTYKVNNNTQHRIWKLTIKKVDTRTVTVVAVSSSDLT